MALRSGHGETLGFGTTTAFLPCYTSIGGFGLSRETLTTSCLTTTGTHTEIGGDLYTISEQTHSYLLDPVLMDTGEAGSIDDLLFDSGSVSAAETITLTFVAGSTIAGSGYVTGFELEDLATDQLLSATITTKYADMPTITGGT